MSVSTWTLSQPFLDPTGLAGKDFTEKVVKIKQAWERDRAKVRSYEEFLILRTRMEADIACAKAIASRLDALVRPEAFDQWLLRKAPGPSTGNWGTTAVAGTAVAAGGWGWGQGGGWGQGAGWGQGTHYPARRDPLWDGVTPVPKTPQKAKRRRLARREKQEAERRKEAAAQLRERIFREKLRKENAGWYPECH
ncbi:hypothetical protein B0H11DRAFT_2215764 [Mycena galericulata]|nr:hypothetical protein B0H11DRAFT_2215754 [Mycena galericulata]KAJ7511026.1 hypothetical protein B0H11DRAFT_2215764 [Mycena galericulata]